MVNIFRTALSLTFLMLCMLIPSSAWSESNQPVAVMHGGEGNISWSPTVSSYDYLMLTVLNPDGTALQEKFSAGVSPSIATPTADGQYTYELKVIPYMDPSVRETLAAARKSGNMTRVNSLRKAGMLPNRRMVQSGYFRIQGGAFVKTNGITE